MRFGWTAVPLGAALLAVLCLGSTAPARAEDVAPSLTVDYDPPRLSVEAHGVSLARLLAEIGRAVGFSVVDRGKPSDPVSISIHGASVSEVLRALLQRENHAVLYLAGTGGEPGSAQGVERIVLLGAPGRMQAAALSRDPQAAPIRRADTGSDRPLTGFPSDGTLSPTRESALLSSGERPPQSGESDPAITIEELLRAHAMTATQTSREGTAGAAGARGSEPPAEVEASLAETTRRAQQGLAALIDGLAAATRSLQESAAAGRR